MTSTFLKILRVCFLIVATSTARSQKIYLDPIKGNDANIGTIDLPLKTINEATRKIKLENKKETAEVILKEGLYVLTETAVFDNNRFSAEHRLIIRAEYLPGDTNWTPKSMPVVLTMVPLIPGTGGDEAKGIQVEVSHVTIQGLRFTGSPDYSYKSQKELRRSYPIWRDGKNLDDLLVTQCLFAGDIDVLPLHVGVIARGNGLVLDHCVFINCKNPVVFWNAGNASSSKNAMRYCLVYGCYFSGIWTTKDTNGDDFEFHHNIIANCKTAWIREQGSTRKYKIHDCIFAGNERIAGYGAGPAGGTVESMAEFIDMERVQLKGTIVIEKDQSKLNYLQLVDRSFGTELKAGLFK